MDNNMDKRLIEVDFPLKQTSLDSVHEKNVGMVTSPPCTSGLHADHSLLVARSSYCYALA